MPVVYAILLADGKFGAAFYVSLVHLVVRAATRGPVAYRKRLWRRIGLITCLTLLSYLAPGGACMDRRNAKAYVEASFPPDPEVRATMFPETPRRDDEPHERRGGGRGQPR